MFRIFLLIVIFFAGCKKLEEIGRPPELTPIQQTQEYYAMQTPTRSYQSYEGFPNESASLWRGDRKSLLGDRRAIGRGDILTVVIEIDDKAEISNSTKLQRKATENLGVPHLFGAPQRGLRKLAEGASYDTVVAVDSQSGASGDGSVKRKEKLMLRVAATIVDVLPNGVLAISGLQEVRVNNELRQLHVTGYVRPEDISRQNQITYDKIASARVSYGGRGDVSYMQTPRYGYKILDALSPF